jgi:hypothetical protein
LPSACEGQPDLTLSFSLDAGSSADLILLKDLPVLLRHDI